MPRNRRKAYARAGNGSATLVHVTDAAPGLQRRRRGRGFAYFDADNRPIRDTATLERIRRLAIPPAYTHVWICANPRGHLQATGRDARGRKQYRYHTMWRKTRDADKFGKLIAFGKGLPRLRRAVRRDLALPGLPEAKVVAIVVSLLAETLIRVGNEEYAQSNGSYGLTTLRSRHLAFLRAGRARFRFRGKSGLRQEVIVDNARLVRLLRRCQRLPGQLLFQYVDDEGARHAIDSDAVNAYLHRAMGEEFTAKDFRTWYGTSLAIASLARTTVPQPAREGRMAEIAVATVKTVAAHLRNTPAVCRNSYIHPCVFDSWRSGRLRRFVPSRMANQPGKLEAGTIRLLRHESSGRH